MSGISAALVAAEERLRAQGFTGARAFDLLVGGLRARLGDPVPVAPEVARVVADIPLDGAGDLLGLAYERFFPDLFKGRRGQFFTPPPIVDVALAFADDPAGRDVLDPTCGSGGFLLRLGEARSVRGIELDPTLHALASLNLRLGGVEARIDRADFFATPPVAVDLLVANPPFSVMVERPDGQVRSDELFLDTLAPWVRPGGQAVVVLPWTIAANPRAEALRARVDASWVRERVLALPEGVFRPFGGAAGRACVVWLRRRPSPDVTCQFATLDDPGFDVRSTAIKRTGTDPVATLRAQGWQGIGDWTPPAGGSTGRRVRELASAGSRGRAGGEPDEVVWWLELADTDRRTGEIAPREGPRGQGSQPALRPGQVLVSRMRPALGNVVWVPEDGPEELVGSPEWTALEADQYPRYLLAALRTPSWRESLPIPTGQTRPRITVDDVLDSRVPWPGDEVAAEVDAVLADLLGARRDLRERMLRVQAAVDAFAAGEIDPATLRTLVDAERSER